MEGILIFLAGVWLSVMSWRFLDAVQGLETIAKELKLIRDMLEIERVGGK